MSASEYTLRYLQEVGKIASGVNAETIESMIDILVESRANGGRIFFLGVGGSAANASHAVNDFRKIAGFECYTPTDNVAELTARTNDDGWETSFVNYLRGSRLRKEDIVFVFSVGGGNLEKNISVNIVRSLQLAQDVGARILGIVGRDGGYTAQVSDAAIVIPTLSEESITPHAEAFQGTLWHLIVSHPRIKQNEMKWESTK